LLDWFDGDFTTASETQKSAFCALLELQDPDLIAYLLGDALPADSRMADVVSSIRNRACSR
jgi:succinate dehydrogenase flavin-adding protein (antitoxin of CptAB toxin-antitoxin module)